MMPGDVKPGVKSAAKAKPVQGVERGDHVYVQHPKRGPMAMKVLATGKDGFVGRCADKQRHRMGWDSYVGHKARVLQRYNLVEQGADGAILEDDAGRRRFLAGHVPTPDVSPDAKPPAGDDPGDDPLTGGMGQLRKAAAGPRDGAPFSKAMNPAGLVPVLVEDIINMQPNLVLFIKAMGQPIHGRPGLALKRVTDKAGHSTQRWAKTGADMPAEKKPGAGADDAPKPAPMQHGDTVGFKHGDVQGSGKIVASGADGVTVHDGQREHQVRHDALTGRQPARPDYPAKADGEDDKAYLKRIKGQLPDPDHLPEDHGKYFNMGDGVKSVPMDQLHSTKSDAENEQGGNNSPKFMAAAYHGQVAKRDPITVKKRADGKGYDVSDSNGTYTGAKKHGWSHLPVKVEGEGGADGGAAADAAGPPDPAPLFPAADVANLPKVAPQPFKDQAALYKASGEALDHLKTWLDRGKGVCSQMGFQTMTCSPEDADMTKPGGMLFIAPLKGEKRAKEKVEADYGGDWSQLRDVVRCSVAVDTMDDIQDALKQLKASGMELAQQPKDRFNKPLPVGYRDLLMNVRFPNGTIGEVQIHLKSMLVAKGEGHKPYEVMRSVDAKPDADKSDTDRKAWQDAFDDSKRIYGEAWKKAAGPKAGPAPHPGTLPGKPGAPGAGAPMQKALAPDAGAGDAGAGDAGGGDAAGGDGQSWEYFDRDGAKFRRPAGVPGGVTDVLQDKAWVPYTGDRTAAYLESDPIPDPLGDGGDDGAGGGGGGFDDKDGGIDDKNAAMDGKGGGAAAIAGAGDGQMVKGLCLFLKAAMPGGAMGDLFASPVQVAGHVRGNGTYVAPYASTRAKAPGHAPAPPATPAGMKDHEHAGVAMAARAWNRARNRTMPSAVAGLGAWGHATQQSFSDDDHDAIARHWDKQEGAVAAVQPSLSVRPAAGAVRVAPVMAPAMLAQLERLKNYPTRHEAVVSKPDGAQSLLAYTPRKSIRGLLDVAQEHGKHILAHLALPDDATMEAAKGAGKQELQFSDGSKVHFSGRTQRDAIMGGQLRHVSEAPAAAAPAPVAVRAPALPAVRQPPPASPEHIQVMQRAVDAAKAMRFKTASQERVEKLYGERLAANPDKFKPGHGVRWPVAGHGGTTQWNRGYRVAEVHPQDLMATIVPVADTGLTTTGGNHDVMGAERVYLGELRRDKAYDR